MTIRVGIGGWNYAPWRGQFYPAELPHRLELHHASRQVTAIEVNATFYRTQQPSSFARWRDEVPEGFVFTLKASRYATNRRLLGEAGDSIHRFVNSGIAELGAKLGPIVWQFAPTKRFDPVDFEAFLQLLPGKSAGIVLRHALEVRHETFMCPEFVTLARKYQAAIVYTDSPKFPSFAERTSDLIYARLMSADARFKEGYPPKALDRWAATARAWAEGQSPQDLPLVGPCGSARPPEDVFLFFINGAKELAPAAARALLKRL